MTDKLSFYIIELPKFEKYKNKENDEAIKKARKVLNDISQDKYEREMAELRLKYVMKMKAEKQYVYDIGLKDGITQGIEQGFEQTKIEIAKKMKSG